MKYEVIRLDHVQVHEPTPFFLDVSCNVYRGEMLCMLIQNQMRSRALMGVLSGQRAHQGGHLYVGNQEVSALTPDSARRAGIYCIGPRPTLIPTLSVAENLFLSQSLFYPRGIFRQRMMEVAAAEWLALAGAEAIAPRSKVWGLDTACAHIIEIVKASVQGARLIVLDNILKFYSDNQRGVFLAFLRRFKDSPHFNASIWAVSDAYSPLWALADRGALVQHGRCVAILPSEKLSREVISGITGAIPSRGDNSSDPPGCGAASLRQASAASAACLPLRLKAGSIQGILDQNQRLRFWDLASARHGLAPGVQVYLDGVRPAGRRANRPPICILNCHEISDCIIESMDLFQNVMLCMGRPVYDFLWKENRRMMEFATQGIFRRYDLMDLFQKFRDRGRLKDLSSSEKFFVFLMRFVVRDPQGLIIIDPQICFEETQYPRFVALMRKVCAQGIALAVVSSTHDILLSISPRYDIIEDGEPAPQK